MRSQIRGTMLAVVFTLMSCPVVRSQIASTSNPSGANYISRDVFTSAGGASSYRDVTYYDGLGYPVQEQFLNANTAGGHLVRPIVYDSMRRDDATVYLPYAVPADSSGFIVDAVGGQRCFYGSVFGDTDAYSFKEYESSSVGRVLSAMREGREYRDHERKSEYEYDLNDDADAVQRMSYVYPSGDIRQGGITLKGVYPETSLAKVSVTDEDGSRTDSYSTPRGRLVCTRAWTGPSSYLETHYVYDLKDSLVCVVQPAGMQSVETCATGTTLSFGSGLSTDQFFLYRYDGEGRVIQSQVPGGGVNEYAYDARGRLVAEASAAMAACSLYRITRYDALDRPAEEYYARLGEGTGPEALRSALRTWDGDEASLPEHSTVRRTYSASYYPLLPQEAEEEPAGGQEDSGSYLRYGDQISAVDERLSSLSEELATIAGLRPSAPSQVREWYDELTMILTSIRSTYAAIRDLLSGNDRSGLEYDRDGSLGPELSSLQEELSDLDGELEGFDYWGGSWARQGSYPDRLESRAEAYTEYWELLDDFLDVLEDYFDAGVSTDPDGGDDGSGGGQEQPSGDDVLPYVPDDLIATAGDLSYAGCGGMLRSETLRSVPQADGTVTGDSLSRRRVFYYDCMGRTIQVREQDSDGWTSCCSTRYDFAGNVTGTLESHTSPSGDTHSVKTLRTLDPRGVVLSETVYADGAEISRTDYSYDELMRPVGRTTGAVSETTCYDIRGWQTRRTADRGQDRIYTETLGYMYPGSAGSAARWTGLISESEIQHCGEFSHGDTYTYDAVGRLTSSALETGISYDANGNVTALQRRASRSGPVTADLTMAYAGNRLESVTNSGSEDAGTFSYTYDSSGNLSFDSRNGLDIRSNVLNLPGRIGTMGGTMTYTYLGDGTKVAARIGTSPRGVSGLAGKRYRGSFVYDVSAAGAESLESIAVSTGRLIALTGTGGTVTFESDGFITDHLGNVAAVVNLSASPATSTQNAILEQNCYTPFGTRLQSTDLKTQAANRWRYAGKEEQNISGMDLGLLDFGARYYDPFTTRWNAVDPLAHKYFSISPYSYCGNDPVNMVDPEGNNWYKDNKTQQYEWFAGTGEIEGYKNCGETIEDMENRNYYSLFGTVVSMDDNYGNLANVYRVIDKALKRYFSPEEVSQNSWDTEYSQTNMKVDFIVTNDFDFVYKGKEFSSIEGATKCRANSIAYSRVTGTISGHQSLSAEYMLGQPNQGVLKELVGQNWFKFAGKYPHARWIVLSGTTKTGRMIEIGFSEQQYKALRETLSKQLGD